MADPYSVLGVGRDASDAELRAAYRRLAKLHHPDHNGGSLEAARRFEAVQSAYAEVQRLRASGGEPRPQARTRRPAEPPPPSEPNVESRLADLEAQVRRARAARQRAEQAAREAARKAAQLDDERRPSDEELGYVTTDDTFSKILADARSEFAQHYGQGGEHPVAKRVSDLIEGLEELAHKLDRPPRGREK